VIVFIRVLLVDDEEILLSVAKIFLERAGDITGMTIQETGTEGKGARFDILAPPGRWRMPSAYG